MSALVGKGSWQKGCVVDDDGMRTEGTEPWNDAKQLRTGVFVEEARSGIIDEGREELQYRADGSRCESRNLSNGCGKTCCDASSCVYYVHVDDRPADANEIWFASRHVERSQLDDNAIEHVTFLS